MNYRVFAAIKEGLIEKYPDADMTTIDIMMLGAEFMDEIVMKIATPSKDVSELLQRQKSEN